MTSALMATYKRLPVSFTRGEGARLWDEAGREYLDALSGIAVCGLGHAHPEIREALCEQAGALIHTSNLYGIPQQEALGAALTRAAGMERVFFGNSGAEANEAAIKLARLHGRAAEIDQPHVVVMENAFHGRTMATLTATGSRRVQAGFEPLLKGFVRMPYGDIQALRNVAESRADIAAVLVEPIQGEGGIHVAPEGYLPQLRELCDQQNWLLMVDEIQTGMGRTGKLFAHQHEGVRPDVMTLAKSLGNGVPIGACLARGGAAELFGPGSHGSTFGGNPLVCRVGLTVLELIEREGLAGRAAGLGERIVSGFHQALDGLEGVVEIRGRGLMIGIELDRPCAELVGRALDAGLLINVTAERVIRLLPPLILSAAQADQLVDSLSELIRIFLSNP
jgi:acetylornithine aminotransferase